MAEEVDQPHAEDHGDPAWRHARLEALEATHEESVHGHVWIPLAREAADALGHPRALAQALEVAPDTIERPHDVEVIDPDEVAPPRVEENELAQREKLERPCEPRLEPTGRPGNPSDSPLLS